MKYDYIEYGSAVPVKPVDERVLDMRYKNAERNVKLFSLNRYDKQVVPKNIEIYLMKNNIVLDDYKLSVLIKCLNYHKPGENYNQQIDYYTKK